MVHVRNANGELSGAPHTAVHMGAPLRGVDPPGAAQSACAIEPEPGQGSEVYGNVSFQLLMRPTSCAATSWTFSFQVPLATSDEALTV